MHCTAWPRDGLDESERSDADNAEPLAVSDGQNEADSGQASADGVTQRAVRSFQNARLKRCTDDGHNTVWLCVDGCARKGVVDSDAGLVRPVVVRIVSIQDGLPLTWFVRPGPVVDAAWIDDVSTALQCRGIDISAVVVDAACPGETLVMLRRRHRPCILNRTNPAEHMTRAFHFAGMCARNANALVSRRGCGVYGMPEFLPNRSAKIRTACVLFLPG